MKKISFLLIALILVGCSVPDKSLQLNFENSGASKTYPAPENGAPKDVPFPWDGCGNGFGSLVFLSNQGGICASIIEGEKMLALAPFNNSANRITFFNNVSAQ